MDEIINLIKIRQEQRATSKSADDLFFQSYAEAIKQYDISTKNMIKRNIAKVFMDADVSVSDRGVNQGEGILGTHPDDMSQFYSVSTPSNSAALPVSSLTTLQNMNFSNVVERDISFNNI